MGSARTFAQYLGVSSKRYQVGRHKLKLQSGYISKAVILAGERRASILLWPYNLAGVSYYEHSH